MKKFGPRSMGQADVMAAIEDWQRKSRIRNPHVRRDRADSMKVIALQGRDLGAMLAYLRHMQYADGRIKLMTVHKAKGLEFQRVYILDQELIGRGGQEQNIAYVAKTRAREYLTYLDSSQLRLS